MVLKILYHSLSDHSLIFNTYNMLINFLMLI